MRSDLSLSNRFGIHLVSQIYKVNITLYSTYEYEPVESFDHMYLNNKKTALLLKFAEVISSFLLKREQISILLGKLFKMFFSVYLILSLGSGGQLGVHTRRELLSWIAWSQGTVFDGGTEFIAWCLKNGECRRDQAFFFWQPSWFECGPPH